MGYKVILSQDRKRAVIHFETRSIELYHSESLVLDLVIWMLSPNGTTSDITYNSYISSLSDTAIIDVTNLSQDEAA